MKSSSKLFSEQQSAEARQWLPPDMNGGQPATISKGRPACLTAPPTAAQLEAVQQEAYQEGYAKGQEEGFAFGH